MRELAPYVAAAVFALIAGKLLARKAPGARWTYPGLALGVLGLIGEVPAWWLRPLLIAASTALVVWDFRRHRVPKRG